MALRRGGSLAADPHLGASLGDTSDVLGLAGETLCWQIQSILCSYRGQFSSLAFGIGAQGQRSARPKHKLGGDLNATVGLFVTPHPPPPAMYIVHWGDGHLACIRASRAVPSLQEEMGQTVSD